MKRRLLSVLGLVALLSGLVIGALPVSAAPPLPDCEPVDIGPEIRQWPATPERIAPFDMARAGRAAPTAVTAAAVGDTKEWMYLDDYTGYYVFDVFTLRAAGEHAEIWVQNNLAWRAGDPRPAPVVTDEQVQYLLAEFENNILPKETEFFATADPHDGTNSLLEAWGYVPPGYYYDEAGRQVVLVSNIRDDNYYIPTYPNYIAGFYSPSFEAYFDRNIMSIDAYDWANRVGPDVARPYLYEGTFAHEYQHLLHDDVDSDEETWVNEGCAEFATFLCGYADPRIEMNPENSLVVWEDQGGLEVLSDYAHAYLWTLSLSEEFGSSFIQALFQNPENSITGVNSTLRAFNISKDFADLYTDWAVKMLIDSKTPAGGRYEFKAVDYRHDIGTPEEPNPQAYDHPGAPPWGTDYIWLTGDPKELGSLVFNGVDYTINPSAWTSDGEVLRSGGGDLADKWAIFAATGGEALTFDTWYQIEELWDFGFVQVSTDGGHSWTSLANDSTISDHDPSAHPKIIDNLPGLTGASDGWESMRFDLSAYAGQDILIAFRYITDWATTEAGWIIDNVYVDDTLLWDGTDASAPFKDLTEYVPVDNRFIVTFVGIKGKGKGNQYRVFKMKLDEVDEAGRFELNKLLKDSDSAVMLVTFAAPEGFSEYADYSYEFTYTNKGPKKPKK